MYHILRQGNGVETWTGNKKNQESIVMEPTSLDILHDRDHMSIRHTGNGCFRAVIGFSVKEYKVLSTLTEKNKFLNAIVKSVHLSGGRFLRRQSDETGWEEIVLKGAKEKVRHALQDVMTTRRKQPKIHEEGLLWPLLKPYYNSADHFDWKGIVMNAESANRMGPHKVILDPTDLDILHGRDDFSIHHIGNTCFHTVIGYSLEQYVILSTGSDKDEFLSAIVDTIHNSGGRFLHR